MANNYIFYTTNENSKFKLIKNKIGDYVTSNLLLSCHRCTQKGVSGDEGYTKDHPGKFSKKLAIKPKVGDPLAILPGKY
jgi:hypothetical protein